ncbi:uncharacterized protein A1O9_01269 [Exophiala aquamarina CBS 119918]|uniref:Late sexual development protein n=1 Tax=Exophiala aquamarina CBS 119918 TaxID=1182545 RepID=A0A072PUA2_9EURO|nr:uncharacterized protein A1O9_01269 [Exophiala aquamarina CBS 119918]KEF63292.1 hypothetical protein A1O9_01269 [Exophiala aquamarina CBS 119918]
MHNKLASVLGSLALVSLVSAVPVEKRGMISYGDRSEHVSSWQASQSYTTSAPSGSNGYSATYASSAPYQTSSSHGAAPPSSSDSGNNPFKFPLSNGFPNIAKGSPQLQDIQVQAHGTLPNGAAPPKPAEDDLLSLRLIAFNELWEVAFFTELLANITNNVPGYQFEKEEERQTIINAITAVQAQEELHTLNANGALQAFDTPILPCTYVAPVADFISAIKLAQKFTDVVLGTLPDVQTHFGQNGDNGLIRGVGSVIGQEGEQNGFYRNILGKIPSANPFLTAGTREFAFNALNQNFIVPGSCPNINTINFGKPFSVLTLETPENQITAKDTTIEFSIAEGDWSPYSSKPEELSLVYINQQNVPITQAITMAGHRDGRVHFTANFPFQENLLFGLTIAVLAQGSSFADVVAVSNATVFGPALIEVL